MSLDYLKLPGHSPGFHLSGGCCQQACFFLLILCKDYQCPTSGCSSPERREAGKSDVFSQGLSHPAALSLIFFKYKEANWKKFFSSCFIFSVICISRLCPAEFTHDSSANIYALSMSQPPIPQLEQESIDINNIWILFEHLTVAWEVCTAL